MDNNNKILVHGPTVLKS